MIPQLDGPISVCSRERISENVRIEQELNRRTAISHRREYRGESVTQRIPIDSLNSITGHTDLLLSGKSAMACFRLLRVGYDTEVICVYVTEPVFYCLLLIIVLCDLYFDSHILLC